MPALKRTNAMRYVSATSRLRANRLLAGAMRRKAKRSRTRGIYSANPHPAPSQAAVNSRSLKAVTYVQQTIRPDSVITNQGLVMDVVTRGTGETQRLGHKWKVTAFHMKGHIRMNSAGGEDYANAGYYLVWDRQPNGNAAQFSQVFNGTAAPYAFPALSGDERFKIIAHKYYNLTFQTTGGDPNSNGQYVIDDYIPMPAGLVCCGTVGGQGLGTIAERQTGALLMFTYSGKSAVTDARPVMVVAHRIYFDDV